MNEFKVIKDHFQKWYGLSVFGMFIYRTTSTDFFYNHGLLLMLQAQSSCSLQKILLIWSIITWWDVFWLNYTHSTLIQIEIFPLGVSYFLTLFPICKIFPRKISQQWYQNPPDVWVFFHTFSSFLFCKSHIVFFYTCFYSATIHEYPKWSIWIKVQHCKSKYCLHILI